jgi:hypothetical protein
MRSQPLARRSCKLPPNFSGMIMASRQESESRLGRGFQSHALSCRRIHAVERTWLTTMDETNFERLRGINCRWLSRLLLGRAQAKHVPRDTNPTKVNAPGALPCESTTVHKLAHIGTRLSDLGEQISKQLVNWGYAICDRILRKARIRSDDTHAGVLQWP